MGVCGLQLCDCVWEKQVEVELAFQKGSAESCDVRGVPQHTVQCCAALTTSGAVPV
jgi:hypothetical protein